jgi:hypothetical protein
VKWDVTLKKDTVDLRDCKNDETDVSQRKPKSTDFYLDMTDKKYKANKKSDDLLKSPTGQMKNMFYSEENSSKLCAQGAIGLMNMLHCSKEDMELFWELATSDLPSIMKSLNESNVPKIFLPGLDIDSIEKCLTILCKKFNFATTTKVKVSPFQSLKPTLLALLEIKFPMLILVESKLATYHHVVVIWQQRVIDYESMFTYPST